MFNEPLNLRRAGRYAGFRPRSTRLPSQGKCNEIKWLGKNVAALIGIAGPRFWEIGSSFVAVQGRWAGVDVRTAASPPI
jgi:hypothetical protein